MKYILYGTPNAYRLTTLENYNAYISDARKIQFFYGFTTIAAVLEYIQQYFKIATTDILINA